VNTGKFVGVVKHEGRSKDGRNMRTCH